jgi:hypothetical protein
VATPLLEHLDRGRDARHILPACRQDDEHHAPTEARSLCTLKRVWSTSHRRVRRRGDELLEHVSRSRRPTRQRPKPLPHRLTPTPTSRAGTTKHTLAGDPCPHWTRDSSALLSLPLTASRRSAKWPVETRLTHTSCPKTADTHQAASRHFRLDPLLLPAATLTEDGTEQPASRLCSTDEFVPCAAVASGSHGPSFHGLCSPPRSTGLRCAAIRMARLGQVRDALGVAHTHVWTGSA